MACRHCWLEKDNQKCADCGNEVCGSCIVLSETKIYCRKCVSRENPKMLGFGRFSDTPINKVPIWYLTQTMNNFKVSRQGRDKAWFEVKRRRDKKRKK